MTPRAHTAIAALNLPMPSAFAAARALPGDLAGPAAAVGAEQLLGLFVSLIVVLIAVVAFLWVMRALQGSSPAGGPIQIIAARSLTAKDKLLVVQVGSERLLIASSPGSISLLHVIAADNDFATATLPAHARTEPFPALLQRLLKREQP